MLLFKCCTRRCANWLLFQNLIDLEKGPLREQLLQNSTKYSTNPLDSSSLAQLRRSSRSLTRLGSRSRPTRPITSTERPIYAGRKGEATMDTHTKVLELYNMSSSPGVEPVETADE